jgi:hypothetical protein
VELAALWIHRLASHARNAALGSISTARCLLLPKILQGLHYETEDGDSQNLVERIGMDKARSVPFLI